MSDSNEKTTKDSNKGVLASTTGNIYGIYDMSGGAYAYLMSNMATLTGDYYISEAGTWTSEIYPIAKYYDFYSYGTTNTDAAAHKRGKLGDATKEVLVTNGAWWYGDFDIFPNNNYSYLMRGGWRRSSGISDAGIFNFDVTSGSEYSQVGSRTSLHII